VDLLGGHPRASRRLCRPADAGIRPEPHDAVALRQAAAQHAQARSNLLAAQRRQALAQDRRARAAGQSSLVGRGRGLAHAERAHQRGVLDWGIARVLGDAELDVATPQLGASDTAADTPMTAAGSVLGTPGYMPPEQVRGATRPRSWSDRPRSRSRWSRT
jgi:hypothetical protein